MKNDMKKNNSKENKADKKVMTRKQALKKAGMLSLTTASMMLLMKTPARAQGSTPTPPPTW